MPTWVPYCRFRFSLTSADGSRVASLATLLAAIYKDVPIASRAGDEIYVPALRCLGHASLDQAFVRLAYAASHAPPTTLRDGPLLPDESGSFVPATLTSAEARQVEPLLLYALLDGPRVARFTRPVERRLLGGSTLHLDEPRLVLLPHASEGDALLLTSGAVRPERVDRCYLERDGAELGLRQRLRISL